MLSKAVYDITSLQFPTTGSDDEARICKASAKGDDHIDSEKEEEDAMDDDQNCK